MGAHDFRSVPSTFPHEPGESVLAHNVVGVVVKFGEFDLAGRGFESHRSSSFSSPLEN